MLFCVSRSCSSCVINNKSHLQILIYWYLNTRLVKNLGTAWTVENFKYMPSIQMHLSSTCQNTHNTGYLRPMCRTKSNRKHTTGPVRQRGRQHGRADCSRSAAESDAFSWRPRHPCQSRIRDRDRPVVGLTHFACDRIKVDLFNKVLKIPIHVLHPVLPSPSVIHSDMVYDPEYTTGLYQRELQTLWSVTSSSECYIWTHTD